MDQKRDLSTRFMTACKYLLSENLALDNKSLAPELGISASMLTEISKGRSNVGSFPIQNIVSKFNISGDWILTGEGNMLKTPNETANAIEITPKFDIKPINISPLDKSLINQRVPLYSMEAIAGVVPVFKDLQNKTPEGFIEIPRAPKCDAAIHITGDSMYPLLKSGDIVMYKILNDYNYIFWGEMYLLSISLDGDDFLTVKYIQKSEIEGYVKLVSQNPHHADKDIPLNSIRSLALIKASIRFNSMY